MKSAIDFEYLSRIRSLVTLSTKRRPGNVLDGEFISVYKGHGWEFDELKEYTAADPVRSIDWKASARTGKTLVRRDVAERKHHVLLLCDEGEKMLGDTKAGEPKREIALLAAGSIAYLCGQLGADFALMAGNGPRIDCSMFRTGLNHLEQLLHTYETQLTGKEAPPFGELLAHAATRTERKMMIFALTDLAGLAALTHPTVEALTRRHDLYLICVSDAMLTDEKSFDLEKKAYADTYLARSFHLRKTEEKERKKISERADQILRAHGASMITISRADEIVDCLMSLFLRRAETLR